MQLLEGTGHKVYHLSAGKTLPEWLASVKSKRTRELAKNPVRLLQLCSVLTRS